MFMKCYGARALSSPTMFKECDGAKTSSEGQECQTQIDVVLSNLIFLYPISHFLPYLCLPNLMFLYPA